MKKKDAVKVEAETPEKMSLSIAIPMEIKRRIQLESLMTDIPAGMLIEEWIDQNVSTESVVVNLADMFEEKSTTESLDPDQKLSGFSALISKHHHALLKLESLRTRTPIRNIIRQWIESQTRDWNRERQTLNQEMKGSIPLAA